LGVLLRAGDMFELGDPIDVRDTSIDDKTGEVSVTTCAACHRPFKPDRVGQKFCSNKCGTSIETATVV
ncbi:MAG: hypothetical protein ACE5H7_13960, partial [Acidiferrobacterales bacterium]